MSADDLMTLAAQLTACAMTDQEYLAQRLPQALPYFDVQCAGDTGGLELTLLLQYPHAPELPVVVSAFRDLGGFLLYIEALKRQLCVAALSAALQQERYEERYDEQYDAN